MNIYIKHPTNPSIIIDINVKNSSLQMTIGTLLKEISLIFFERGGNKHIDITDFWKLRDEKTNEYMDANLPLSKLNTDDKFSIAFGRKINGDLEKINAYAEELNQEAEDVLDYQVIS